MRSIICRNLPVTLTTAFLLITSAALQAAIPPTVSYQGRIVDSNGDPIPDNDYDMFFYIYDAATFGTQLWASGQDPIQVKVINGLFSVNLGDASMNPLPSDVFDGSERYLEAEIDGEGSFTPRKKFVATPYSFKALDSDNLGGVAAGNYLLKSGGTMSGALQFEFNASDSEILIEENILSPTIWFYANSDPRVRLTNAGGGLLDLYDSQTMNTVKIHADDQIGGFVELDDTQSNLKVELRAGSAGEGSRLNMYGALNSRVRLWAGDHIYEPLFRMVKKDATQAVEIDLGVSGDNSVQLPEEAISAPEIEDEPGFAGVEYRDSTVSLQVANENVAEVTIDLPASGHVLLLASGQITVVHVQGTLTEVQISVSEVSTVVDPAPLYSLPASHPTGIYKIPFSLNKIEPFGSAGSATYYLEASRLSASSDPIISDVSFTAIYLPTGYGDFTTD